MKEYFISVIIEILDTYLKILSIYDINQNKSMNEKYAIITKMKQFNIEEMADEFWPETELTKIIEEIKMNKKEEGELNR